MKFFKWKNLKKYMLPSLMMFAFFPNVASEAANVTNVYLGNSSSYTDPDVPPAIKLNEAVGGLPAGTYLYRTTWKDIYYYTPVTPVRYRNTSNEPQQNKNLRNWGPWDMPQNQSALSNEIRSNKKYFNKVTIPSGTRVYGSNISTVLGSLSSSASVTVRAHTVEDTGTFIYFSLVGTSLEGANAENIGRVYASKIITSEIPTTVFRSGSNLEKKFSYLANYKDTTDSSHEHLEKAVWKNNGGPLSGLNGEWCYLGYNAKGEPLSNPYFPSTRISLSGASAFRYYPFRSDPFNNGSNSIPKTHFDGAGYLQARKDFIQLLKHKGVLPSDANLTTWANKLSFLTHPLKDTAVIKGVRQGNTFYTRQLSFVNPTGDLYLERLEVYDGSTKVASYYYNINTGTGTRTNGHNIVPGKNYTVKVKIGNSKDRDVLASSCEALTGITKESSYLSLDTLSVNQLNDVSVKEDQNPIGSSKGSTSNYINFTVKAPDDVRAFDIYGMVGESHYGSDNMDDTNDAGFVRMYMKDWDKKQETVWGEANLTAGNIELLDPSTHEVLYSSLGLPEYKAIVPGRSYKIRYNFVNTGDTPMMKIITPGPELPDGSFGPNTVDYTYPTTKITISYTNTLKVNASNGSLANVSFNGSNKKILKNGSENISTITGETFSYVTDAVYFAYPYFDSSFTINVEQGMFNSDTTDDTISDLLVDKFDFVISDVKLYPAYEYVFNDERKVIYNITYKAKIDAAQHIKNAGTSMAINTSITVGDRTLPFKDVLIANNEWQEFSHTLEKVTLKNDTTGVKAIVKLNHDGKVYETNYNNNTGESAASTVKVVSNPFNGSNDDKVTSVDTSNGSSLNGGGVLNNNCLIPRRNNSWTMSHRKHSWSYSQKQYTIDNNTYYSDVYTTSSDSTVTKSYTESFNIKKIEFKSKETEGKGTNGWINLLSTNPQTLELAKVKAGYGFELRIVTEYRTDATRTQPIGNSTTKYTGIIGDNDPGHAWNKGINYSDELFVELPGTEGVHGTRKILSTTGYSGTTNGLVISERDLSTSDEVVKEFTYTIKPSNTLGINEVGKIFIPTGLKDGKYKISVYTPPISGAISNGKNKYTSLCDRRDVYINVSGSYTDDLNSNIIQ